MNETTRTKRIVERVIEETLIKIILAILTVILLLVVLTIRKTDTGEDLLDWLPGSRFGDEQVEPEAADRPAPTALPGVADAARATPIAGQSLYRADTTNRRFADWSDASGWYVSNGMLLNDGTGENERIWPPFQPGEFTDNYAVEAEIGIGGCSGGGNHSFGMDVRSQQGQGKYLLWVPLGDDCEAMQSDASLWRVNFQTNLTSQDKLKEVHLNTDTSWHTYRIEVQGDRIYVLLDGAVLLKTTDDFLVAGGATALFSDGVQLRVRRFEVLALGAADSTLRYDASWSDNGDGWSIPASWTIRDGMLVNDGSNPYANMWIPAPWQSDSPDYAVEVELQLVELVTDDGRCQAELPSFGVVARAADVDEHHGFVDQGYMAGVVFDGDCAIPHGQIWSIATAEFNASFEAPVASEEFDPGTDWHTYRFEVRGNELRFLIDGNLRLETTLDTFAGSGQVGLWSDSTELNVRRFKVFAL